MFYPQMLCSTPRWHVPTPLDQCVAVFMFHHLPNRVQNMPPRIGSGREAKRAVNLPTVPRRNMMTAPYWTTLLLPTWGGRGGERERG